MTSWWHQAHLHNGCQLSHTSYKPQDGVWSGGTRWPMITLSLYIYTNLCLMCSWYQEAWQEVCIVFYSIMRPCCMLLLFNTDTFQVQYEQSAYSETPSIPQCASEFRTWPWVSLLSLAPHGRKSSSLLRFVCSICQCVDLLDYSAGITIVNHTIKQPASMVGEATLISEALG